MTLTSLQYVSLLCKGFLGIFLGLEVDSRRWGLLQISTNSRLTCVLQTEDIDLSGNRYNLLGTIFYIAYILSQ
jgi:hypothetical protein